MIAKIGAVLAIVGVVASLFLIPLSLRTAITSIAPTPAPKHRAVASAPVNPSNPLKKIDANIAAPPHHHHAVKHAVKRVIAKARSYTVRTGDSLWTIGVRFHVNYLALYQLNRQAIGDNPNVIHTGEVLQL